LRIRVVDREIVDPAVCGVLLPARETCARAAAALAASVEEKRRRLIT
jgi:hypothetical protein